MIQKHVKLEGAERAEPLANTEQFFNSPPSASFLPPHFEVRLTWWPWKQLELESSLFSLFVE